jgi:hypothetical protein
LTISSLTKRVWAGVGAADGLDRGRAAFSRRLEGGGTDGDHLLGVRRLDGLQGVAGIDRAHEGVGRDDLDDVGDRGDVQLGGDARGEVLAARGGRNQDRVVIAGQGENRVGLRLGQAVAQGGALGQQHLADAGDLGGGVGHGLGAHPATSTSTSPDSFRAAVTVLWVLSRRCALSLSATTRTAIRAPPRS